MNKKVAIIGDTHWGIKGDSPIFHENMKKFLDKTFFPYLKDNNIDTVIHLGDLVDKRKIINFSSSNRLKTDFINRLVKEKIKVYFIVGNHDTYYKNTNSLNVYKELQIEKYENIFVFENPQDLVIKDTSCLFLPWICKDNKELSYKTIEKSNSRIVFSHLELCGFEFSKGIVSKHGDDPSNFNKFEFVFSGHYHTRSNKNNIYYLGSPIEFTWIDYHDPKGFHVFDFSNFKLEFIQNEDKIFKKFFYNDNGNDPLDIDFSQYENSVVKLVVIDKQDEILYSKVIKKIEESNPFSLTIEDALVFEFEDIKEEQSKVDDTFSIIKEYVNVSNIENKDKIISKIEDLYFKANESVFEC